MNVIVLKDIILPLLTVIIPVFLTIFYDYFKNKNMRLVSKNLISELDNGLTIIFVFKYFCYFFVGMLIFFNAVSPDSFEWITAYTVSRFTIFPLPLLLIGGTLFVEKKSKGTRLADELHAFVLIIMSIYLFMFFFTNEISMGLHTIYPKDNLIISIEQEFSGYQELAKYTMMSIFVMLHLFGISLLKKCTFELKYKAKVRVEFANGQIAYYDDLVISKQEYILINKDKINGRTSLSKIYIDKSKIKFFNVLNYQHQQGVDIKFPKGLR